METYENPLKKRGDFADPYVLRFNGKYYLYCTNPDVRCWSSSDLVNWTAEGATIEEDTFPGLVPFAPEVTYWNGSFYMYTSPSGHGHYILKSKSPTGPFKMISENNGHNIDGSVFIDDNGKWYFYWAHDDGIMGCEMNSPTDFGNPVNTGAYLHGWTEGPSITKESGKYYMTFTGNHYLSDGYRVNIAVSDAPLGPYKDCPYNPILVHTTGKNIGLGHNSITWAPDLNSKYIIYHNMNSDLTRDLNIDAINMVDGKAEVAGPTRCAHPAPRKPMYYCHPNVPCTTVWTIETGSWEQTNAYWITNGDEFKAQFAGALPEEGTIECNIASEADRYGLEVSDCRLEFDRIRDELAVYLKNNRIATINLDNSVAFEALHAVMLKYYQGRTTIFLDNRKIFEGEFALSGEKTLKCYSAQGRLKLGCTAVSERITPEESMVFSIPSRFFARSHFTINVPETSSYNMFILSATDVDVGSFSIYDSRGQLLKLKLVCRTKNMAEFQIELCAGVQELYIKGWHGLQNADMFFIDTTSKAHGQHAANISIDGNAKKDIVPIRNCTNFNVQITIPLENKRDNSEIGVMFRASELSLGGEGKDELLGINFFIGYSLSLKDGELTLAKHRYDYRKLASTVVYSPTGNNVSIRIKCILNRIEVYLGDEHLPTITYFDSEPILCGKLGYRAINSDGMALSYEIVEEDTYELQ